MVDVLGARLVSDREVQVMKGLAAGLKPGEIGRSLGISPQSVNNHRYTAMKKLAARSSAHLLAIAISRGLID